MDFIQSGPSVTATAIAHLLLWILAFFGWGRVVLEGHSTGVPGAVALGLFFLSLWVFFFGLVGGLYPVTVYCFLAVGLILFLRTMPWKNKWSWQTIRSDWDSPSKKVYFFLVILLGIVSLLASTAPVIANDALAYHLYFPRLNAESHQLFYDPTHARSLWPSLMSMVFTAALLTQGTALASLFSWLTAVLTFWSILGIARKHGMGSDGPYYSFLLATAVPAIWMQSIDPYTDNAMMLFLFLAFFSLWEWRNSAGEWRTGLAAGCFLAAAVSTKMFMIGPCLFLFLLLGGKCWRRTGPVFLIASALSGPWFIRSWVLTGNPVFPFFGSWFGGAGYSQRMFGFAEMPKTLSNFVLVPWNTAFKVDVFGGEPLGCLLLAAGPVLILAQRPWPSLARHLLVFAVGFAAIWYSMIQHIRFLFPAVPFFSLLIGWGLAQWSTRNTRVIRVGLNILFFAAMLQIGLAFYYMVRPLQASLGSVSAQDYLRRYERTYPVFERMLRWIPPKEGVLFLSEHRLFYSPYRSVVYDPAIRLDRKKTGLSFDEWMKHEQLHYILTSNRSPQKLLPSQLLDPEDVVSPSGVELFSYESPNPEDKMYYKLWRLERP